MFQQTFFLLLNYRFSLLPLSSPLSLSLFFKGGARRARPRLNPRLHYHNYQTDKKDQFQMLK